MTPQNLLASETSPYLLQHAHNPVAWNPWGAAALERAAREDKPIFLSIGYAACHWCHVMERESFENQAVADFLNEHFVSIKVDREERPDLDEIYMAATIGLSGSGGWPMTVFLTPAQEPFFAGTYFPPDGRYGRPGFLALLQRIAEVWAADRSSILSQAEQLTEHVRQRSNAAGASSVSSESTELAVREYQKTFDAKWGGFGAAPKFPPHQGLRLLLRHHARTGQAHVLDMVTRTLDGMKNGGIYDQVGGGFARYSTDERWLVPHFEKMLYDNAQLAVVYLEAFQVTKDREYERIARETLDYIAREMQSPEGGYYSATDADSEGVEGKFFCFLPEEIDDILGKDPAEAFCLYYDVSVAGNWEGHNVLNTPRPLAEVAKDLGCGVEELEASLARSRLAVYEARKARVPPLCDDKVLAGWNGLMIEAMAEGYRILREPRYLESATRAAHFVCSTLLQPDGRLFRTARGGKAHIDAFLEDYAYLADALITLYEAGGDAKWLTHAHAFSERILTDFAAEDGSFFTTGSGHEPLIARIKEGYDGALPNPNAVAARALARLAHHFDLPILRERASRSIAAYGKLIERAPRAFATALATLEFLLCGPTELVLAGAAGSPETEALARAVAAVYLPNRVIALSDPGMPNQSPLGRGKTLVDEKPALYVCRNFTCQAPISDPTLVGALLTAEQKRHAATGSIELPIAGK
jgi:uncharacterized protein YyaL (SSP411 family)